MRSLVGENVRSRRQALGMTQEAFAAKSGLSQQYISGLERGLRNPTVVTLFEMSVALDCSPADLISPASK